MKVRVFVIIVAILIVPPFASRNFETAAKEPLSIFDVYMALTQQDLDDFNVISSRWVEAFIDEYDRQWPDHAEFVGFFAGEPSDPEKMPTFFTLRIPEGWEMNGRVIYEQAAGVNDHTWISRAIANFLSIGQTHIMVNTFDLVKGFLPPNSLEKMSKRMNQAPRHINPFLNSKFGNVTYTYAHGWSRGGQVLNLAAEDKGTPFDGLLAWESGKDWKTVVIESPHILRTWWTPADDPKLERAMTYSRIVSLAQNLGLLIMKCDPAYLVEGGTLENYDLSIRPQDVQNYFNSKKVATTGNVATKEILFWGLDDLASYSKKGIDYFKEVLAQNKQDDVRLYMGKSYTHLTIAQDLVNGMKLLQDWVENGIEPGVLTTVMDGDIQHSRSMELENDPLQYALTINNQ